MERGEFRELQGNGSIPAEVLELSQGELIEEIDREAEARLGMSLERLVEEYRRGTLPDTLAVNELVILLRLVDLSDVPT